MWQKYFLCHKELLFKQRIRSLFGSEFFPLREDANMKRDAIEEYHFWIQ